MEEIIVHGRKLDATGSAAVALPIFGTSFTLGELAEGLFRANRSARLQKMAALAGAGLAAPIAGPELLVTITGILLSELVLAGVAYYYENNDPTPEALALIAAMNAKYDQLELPKDKPIVAAAIENLDQSVTGADSALSLNGEITLENAEELDYDPAPPPVPRITDSGTEVKVDKIESGLEFVIRPVDVHIDKPAVDPFEDMRTVIAPMANLEVPIPGADVILGGQSKENELINTIPATAIHIGIKSPADLLDWTSPAAINAASALHVRVVARSVAQAIDEAMTIRQDAKPRGLWYLAALRFVNRTWGRLTELDDFSLVFQRNMILPEMWFTYKGYEYRIHAGTEVSKLDLQQKEAVLAAIEQGKYEYTFNFEKFVVDLFVQEMTDVMIGLAMMTERMAIDRLGLRGMLDYGNISTWLRRLSIVGKSKFSINELIEIINESRKKQEDDDEKDKEEE